MSRFATLPEQVETPEPLRGREREFKALILTRYYAHKNIERVVEAPGLESDEQLSFWVEVALDHNRSALK